jgi:hypothetical protein
MAKNKNRREQARKEYVRGSERRPMHRPEPPQEDRRTKRNRTRQAQKRNHMKEYE